MPPPTDFRGIHWKNIHRKTLKEKLKRFQRRGSEDRRRGPEETSEKNLRERACLGAAGLVGRQGKNRTPQTSLQSTFLGKQEVSTDRAVSPERDPATEAARITRDDPAEVARQKELAN